MAEGKPDDVSDEDYELTLTLNLEDIINFNHKKLLRTSEILGLKVDPKTNSHELIKTVHRTIVERTGKSDEKPKFDPSIIINMQKTMQKQQEAALKQQQESMSLMISAVMKNQEKTVSELAAAIKHRSGGTTSNLQGAGGGGDVENVQGDNSHRSAAKMTVRAPPLLEENIRSYILQLPFKQPSSCDHFSPAYSMNEFRVPA